MNLQCGADNIQLSLAEVKLAWIVHIVAAILKTKQISGFRLNFSIADYIIVFWREFVYLIRPFWFSIPVENCKKYLMQNFQLVFCS